MTRISELIERLCPNGVEYYDIKEIAEVGTGSSNRDQNVEEGLYPFYVRSKNILRSQRYLFDEEAIVIPGEGGVGDVFHYVCGKYDLHQRAYRISFDSTRILTRFAFYVFVNSFKSYIIKKSVTATVASIRKPMIEDFRVPIPSLEVQQEIVRILDALTTLETELETELEAEMDARKKQYEYYRDTLFALSEFNAIEHKKIGEFSICYSGATPNTNIRDYWENGEIPWMSSGEVNKRIVYSTDKMISKLGYNKSSTKMVPPDSVIIALAGQGKTRGTVAMNKIPLCTNQSLCSIIPNENVNSEF
jgi:type I restriction enzyme, S subunit